MKIPVAKSTLPNPLLSLRRLGYGLLMNRNTGKQSFVKHLSSDVYPRFHLYVENEGENWSLNLHLDQRRPVYAGATAHAGDYDGPVVEAEARRIETQLKK